MGQRIATGEAVKPASCVEISIIPDVVPAKAGTHTPRISIGMKRFNNR
jgi:hypothetical protein